MFEIKNILFLNSCRPSNITLFPNTQNIKRIVTRAYFKMIALTTYLWKHMTTRSERACCITQKVFVVIVYMINFHQSPKMFTVSFVYTECIDSLCACHHLHKIPKPNITTTINGWELLNVKWNISRDEMLKLPKDIYLQYLTIE